MKEFFGYNCTNLTLAQSLELTFDGVEKGLFTLRCRQEYDWNSLYLTMKEIREPAQLFICGGYFYLWHVEWEDWEGTFRNFCAWKIQKPIILDCLETWAILTWALMLWYILERLVFERIKQKPFPEIIHQLHIQSFAEGIEGAWSIDCMLYQYMETSLGNNILRRDYGDFAVFGCYAKLVGDRVFLFDEENVYSWRIENILKVEIEHGTILYDKWKKWTSYKEYPYNKYVFVEDRHGHIYMNQHYRIQILVGGEVYSLRIPIYEGGFVETLLAYVDNA